MSQSCTGESERFFLVGLDYSDINDDRIALRLSNYNLSAVEAVETVTVSPKRFVELKNFRLFSGGGYGKVVVAGQSFTISYPPQISDNSLNIASGLRKSDADELRSYDWNTMLSWTVCVTGSKLRARMQAIFSAILMDEHGHVETEITRDQFLTEVCDCPAPTRQSYRQMLKTHRAYSAKYTDPLAAALSFSPEQLDEQVERTFQRETFYRPITHLIEIKPWQITRTSHRLS